jgi:hypothetical protein
MRRQKSQKSAIRCDKKRQKATFSQKVLTIPLFRLKFLLELIRDGNQQRYGQGQKGRGEISEY